MSFKGYDRVLVLMEYEVRNGIFLVARRIAFFKDLLKNMMIRGIKIQHFYSDGDAYYQQD